MTFVDGTDEEYSVLLVEFSYALSCKSNQLMTQLILNQSLMTQLLYQRVTDFFPCAYIISSRGIPPFLCFSFRF